MQQTLCFGILLLMISECSLCPPSVEESHRVGCEEKKTNMGCCKRYTDLEYCCPIVNDKYPNYENKLCCAWRPVYPHCCDRKDCCDYKPTNTTCRRILRGEQLNNVTNCRATDSAITYKRNVTFANNMAASECLPWEGTETAACRVNPDTRNFQCRINGARDFAQCELPPRCEYNSECADTFEFRSWKYTKSCVVLRGKAVCSIGEIGDAFKEDDSNNWIDCSVYEEALTCVNDNDGPTKISCSVGQNIAVIEAKLITNSGVKSSWCNSKKYTDVHINSAESKNVTEIVQKLCDNKPDVCSIDHSRFDDVSNGEKINPLYIKFICQSRTARKSNKSGLGCTRSKFGYTYNIERSKSVTGSPCAQWSSIIGKQKKSETEKYHFLGGIEKSGNFCRNPDGTENGPWCHIFRNTELKRETCGVPRCANNQKDCTFPFHMDGYWYYDCARHKHKAVCATGKSMNRQSAPKMIECGTYEEERTCLNSKRDLECTDEKVFLVLSAKLAFKDSHIYCGSEATKSIDDADGNVTEQLRRRCDGESKCSLHMPDKHPAVLYLQYICSKRVKIILPDTSNECKHGDIGDDYAGHVAITASGHLCADWDQHHADEEHGITLPKYSRNYCRNPTYNTTSGPWCYRAGESITSPIAESCGLQRCSFPETCVSTFTESGAMYTGCVRRHFGNQSKASCPTNALVEPTTTWLPCSNFSTIRACAESVIKIRCIDRSDSQIKIHIYALKLIDASSVGESACYVDDGGVADASLEKKIAQCHKQNACHVRRSHNKVVVLKYGCVRFVPDNIAVDPKQAAVTDRPAQSRATHTIDRLKMQLR